MSDLFLRHAGSPIHLTNEMQKTRLKNKVLLLQFKQWLRQKKTRENTISNHVKNCDFFLNEFLVHLEIFSAREGFAKINMFLGYWFIKRAVWATPAAIKSNAVSLELFYTFLCEKGELKKASLKELSNTIKSKRSQWIASMKWYAKQEINDIS